MMHRFFVSHESIEGDQVSLQGEVAHRLSRVLRLSPGDQVLLLDGSGNEYQVRLSAFDKDNVQGRVEAVKRGAGEPATKITLYQGLLKGEKFQWVLQKGTELGISAFVPMNCARSIAHPGERWTTSKLRRWEKIICEAAEQSGRSILPRLYDPVSFGDACCNMAGNGISIIPWEEETSRGLRAVLGGGKPAHVNLFIGPEGGFEETEIAGAVGCGISPVTLGKRILRAETAGLVAAAAIFYHLGDIGG